MVLVTEHYPWLDAQRSQLVNLHKADRLPHALLLAGPAGIGKLQLADGLFSYLLCKSPVNGQACGECKSCQLLKAGNHPDLFRLEPEEPGKAIKIDAVRRAAHFVAQTPQLGGYRCLVISPAENLNTNAANALLKILEEPGDATLFVLVSSQPSQISATVRSRCSRIEIPLPSVDDSKQWLKQRLSTKEADDAQLDALLAVGGGSPLLAINAHDADWLKQRATLLVTLTKLLERSISAPEAARLLEPVELVQLIGWWQLLANDAIKSQMMGENAPITAEPERALINKIAQQLSANALYLTIDALLEAKQTLLSGFNPNKILMLEDLLIRWSHASQAATVRL